MSEYQVKEAKNDAGFYFVLVADNGEIVSTSEIYPTRVNAARGAEDAKAASAETPDEAA